MRLIDADRLKEVFRRNTGYDYSELIDIQPTVNVLDKIREAVESIDTRYYSSVYGMDMTECADDFKHEILLIINKYMEGAILDAT